MDEAGVGFRRCPPTIDPLKDIVTTGCAKVSNSMSNESTINSSMPCSLDGSGKHSTFALRKVVIAEMVDVSVSNGLY